MPISSSSVFLKTLHDVQMKHDKETLALLKALWFYAHKANYVTIHDAMDYSTVSKDYGSIARKAISEFSGMDKYKGKEA